MVKYLDLIKTYHVFSLKIEIQEYVQNAFVHPIQENVCNLAISYLKTIMYYNLFFFFLPVTLLKGKISFFGLIITQSKNVINSYFIKSIMLTIFMNVNIA